MGTSLILKHAPLGSCGRAFFKSLWWSQGPAAGLFLSPYGGPRGGAISSERSTPVPCYNIASPSSKNDVGDDIGHFSTFAGKSTYMGTSLIRKRNPFGPPSDPTIGLCLGSLGGPRGLGVSSWARYPCTL